LYFYDVIYILIETEFEITDIPVLLQFVDGITKYNSYGMVHKDATKC